MTHKEWERLGAAAGIIAVAVFFTALLLPGTLATDATAVEIRSFVVDNRDQFLAQAVMVGGGVLLFLLFIATLRNVLRRTEGGTGELSAVMSGSALVVAAMILVLVSASAGLAYRSADALDPTIVRFIFDLITVGFTFVGIPTAVFLGTAAVLMRRSEVFPVWMPAVGGVAAAVNALAPVSVLFTKGAWGPMGVASYAPAVAFMLVVLATGGILVRHPEAGEVRMPMTSMAAPA